MSRLIEPERALGHAFEPEMSRWTPREVALYALATGAAEDPSDDRQWRRAYEHHPAGMEVLPGFVAVLALNALVAGLRKGQTAPGLNYGIDRVMHAEERLTLYPAFASLGASGALAHRAKIAAIHDKGRHAFVVTEVESRTESGAPVMKSEITSLVRSAGGFGGTRGDERAPVVIPARDPDVRTEQKTHANQALLFRLLGDDNPLHADPRAARAFGLKTPILHGMCTFGHALRHVTDAFPDLALEEVSVRFSDVVFPGETLMTEAWRDAEDPRRVVFQTRVRDRDKIVLSLAEARFAAPDAKRESDTNGVDANVQEAVDAIARHVAARPALVRAIGAAFQFHLREPRASFVIDLRKEPGTVRLGTMEDADCTLELATKDFFALKRAEALGRALYLTGALKMTGKTTLAPHLDFLREVGEPANGGGASAPATAADGFRALLTKRLEGARVEGAQGANVALMVEGDAPYTLRFGPTLEVEQGEVSAPVATIWLSKSGASAFARGERSLFALYMRGEAKVEGEMAIVRALEAGTAR